MWVDCKSSEERADRKQTRIPQLKGKLHLIKHPRRDWNSGLAKKKKEKHKTNSFPPSVEQLSRLPTRTEDFLVKSFRLFFYELLSGLGNETTRW